jgi:hypothetical protein
MPQAPVSVPELSATIVGRIFNVRGQRVLLDADLAALYGVGTRRLNEAVKRNSARFPADFAMRLNHSEFESLMSQFATSKSGRGGRRKLPMVFTEHGALMAANIVNSRRAVEMSVYVVRAFVRLRSTMASHAELARELNVLKRFVARLDESTRKQFYQVYEAILGLMMPAPNRH